MAIIRFTVNTTGGTAPLEYRLNGGAWQGSNVFEIDSSIAQSQGVIINVRDSNGCIDTENLTEDPIAFVDIAGYTNKQGEVHAIFETNILAEAQIDYGVGEDYPYDPNNFEGTSNWTNDFVKEHDIKFPVSFIGGFHFFRARVKSIFGQELESDIYGIFYVPDELTQEKSMYTYVEDSGIFVPKTHTEQNSGNISVQTQTGPQGNPSLAFSTEVQPITKTTPKTQTQQVTAIELNVTIT